MTTASASPRRCLRYSTGALALGVALFCYAFWIEPRWIQITRIEIPIPGLPQDLDGLAIAQLSDLHLGPHIEARHIGRAVDLVNDLKPDLVVLTGDYVSGSADFAGPCAVELSRLNAPYGVSAVLGNHDEWTSAETVAQELRHVGIRVLRNEAQEIHVGAASLWLLGIDDAGVTGVSWQAGMSPREFAALWAIQREAYEETKTSIPAGAPVILLAHNPDFVETVKLEGICLGLCGHTHGGQIRIPMVGSLLLPSIHGQKYASGLAECQGVPIYVNRGIGLISPPLRFLCRPEVTLILLRTA